MNDRGSPHHAELRVAGLEKSNDAWGSLLAQLDYEPYRVWSDGRSWSAGARRRLSREQRAVHGRSRRDDRRRPDVELGTVR